MHPVEIDPTLPEWKQKIERFINHPTIQHAIVFLIVLNAALLGMETSPGIVEWVFWETVTGDSGGS